MICFVGLLAEATEKEPEWGIRRATNLKPRQDKWEIRLRTRFSRYLFNYTLLALPMVFWTMSYLLEIFDFGKGFDRALILLVVLLLTPILVHFGSSSRKIRFTKRMGILLVVLASAAFAWHVQSAYQNFLNANLVDIATTTFEAGKAILRGQNPYSVPIGKGIGYTYGPMMALAFLPLGQVWGIPGIIATNLVLDLIALVLIFLLGSRVGSPSTGLYAIFLYLVSSFVPLELFGMGSTDLAAVVPLLLALLIIPKKKGLAGCSIGLAISAKYSPGIFLALCCFPKSGRLRYLAGIATGLLPILAYLSLSPMDFITSTITKIGRRPIDSTSWMYGNPWAPEIRLVVPIALAITLVCVGIYVWANNPSKVQRCGLAVVCILVAMLTGPVVHRNYQLWWLPFFAVLVAGATLASAKFSNGTRGTAMDGQI